MSLFSSTANKPFNSNFNSNSSMNYGNPFNRTNNSVMPNPFAGSSLSGPNSLFPSSGSNNLFGNNTSGGSGNMWGNTNNNNNNNILRSNTMPNSLFPTSGGPSNQMGGNSNLFQPNNNSVFPRSNSMLNSGSNFLGTGGTGNNGMTNNFFGQSNNSHGYSTRGNNMTIDKGSIGHKHNPGKTAEGLYVYSITHDKAFAKKCLDEIRMEDYAFMKSGQVPESVQKIIMANKQGMESGTMGMGSNGVMIGSSANNLFGTNQVGMGMNNNNSMGMNNGMGMNNSMGMNNNNLFGNNSMQKNNNWFGGNSGNTNNLFQNNNSMNSSGSYSFGQQGGMGNSNSNFSSNNLFTNNNNNNTSNNLFTNNSNQGNFMSNQTSASNIFNSNNKFQPNSPFSQPNNNNSFNNNLFSNQSGNNTNNLFVNRPNSVFPGSMPTSNNNLFSSRNPPNSLFPNQQPSNSLFPQQNQSGGGHQQLIFTNQPPHSGFASTANPHLFPGSYSGFPNQQGFYPPGQMSFGDGMNQNPQLFPGQPGQMQLQQQTPFQQYLSMQQGIHDATGMSGMSGYSGSGYIPYQEEKQSYTPRQTLTDAILNFDKKLADDVKESPKPAFTYLPYNLFEKKNKKMDLAEKENLRNISLLRPAGSLIRRDDDDDAFSLIKKTRHVVEDDVEIIMKPKFFLPTGNRPRSTSPASSMSRSRDHSRERPGRGRNIYNDSVKVKATVTIGNYLEKSIEARIYRQNNVLDLKIKLLEKLRETGALRYESANALDVLAKTCGMFYDSKLVFDDQTLSSIGMGGEECHAYLQVDEEHASEELIESFRRRKASMEVQAPSSSGARNIFKSRHLPKLTKAGYQCSPSIEEMSEMNDKELATVERFTVWNEHGKVEFEGRTDVRDLDLDDLIVINHNTVEVYPEERYPTEESRPRIGDKLNKPALITLFNCFWKSKTSGGEDVKKKLEEKAHKLGYEFIEYDEKNGIYKISIPHF